MKGGGGHPPASVHAWSGGKEGERAENGQWGEPQCVRLGGSRCGEEGPKNREKEIRSFLGLQRQVPSQARPQEPGVEGPQGRAGVLEEREIDFESGFWRSVR